MRKLNSSTSYLVTESLLPDAIRRTAHAKEMLNSGAASSLPEALEKAGISKSTYYKYKDGVFSFYNLSAGEIVNLSMTLKNKAGTLSGVLSKIAEFGGNVLTINQGLPAMGEAVVTLSVGLGQTGEASAQMVERLSSLPGVGSVHIDGILYE